MPDTDIETERQVRHLEEQFKRLSITDSEGDLETGFAIRRDIVGAVGACCLGGSCQSLSQIDCIAVGGTYHGDQSPCDPNPCVGGTGACCCPDDPTCFISTEADCIACCPVCTYHGNGSTCTPNPCGGACCVSGTCVDSLNESDCVDNFGGVYQGDHTVCDPDPCPSACCVQDSPPACRNLTASDCASVGGTSHPGSVCDAYGNDPCCYNVTAHLTICWQSDSYPDPDHPSDLCVVSVSESVTASITLQCPFHSDVSGEKSASHFTYLLTSVTETPSSCSGQNLSGAFFEFGSIGLFWDTTNGWNIGFGIVFPNWPATFLYTALTPGFGDLRTLGTLTGGTGNCPISVPPSPGDPALTTAIFTVSFT